MNPILLTSIIAGVIGVAFVAVLVTMIINKKRGKSSCSCGCGGCAMRDMCHKEETDK